MRLGQEFSGYSRQVEAARERVEAALPGIHELALGGTALGTGLNALPGFAAAVITEIAQETGMPFHCGRTWWTSESMISGTGISICQTAILCDRKPYETYRTGSTSWLPTMERP